MWTLDTTIEITGEGLSYLRTRSLTDNPETRRFCICGRQTTGEYGGTRYCSRCLAVFQRLDEREREITK